MIYEHCRGPKAARARDAAPVARRARAAVPVAPNARNPLPLSVASTEKREQDTKRRDIKKETSLLQDSHQKRIMNFFNLRVFIKE